MPLLNHRESIPVLPEVGWDDEEGEEIGSNNIGEDEEGIGGGDGRRRHPLSHSA